MKKRKLLCGLVLASLLSMSGCASNNANGTQKYDIQGEYYGVDFNNQGEWILDDFFVNSYYYKLQKITIDSDSAKFLLSELLYDDKEEKYVFFDKEYTSPLIYFDNRCVCHCKTNIFVYQTNYDNLLLIEYNYSRSYSSSLGYATSSQFSYVGYLATEDFIRANIDSNFNK